MRPQMEYRFLVDVLLLYEGTQNVFDDGWGGRMGGKWIF
jgi:hypothetical protein